jgi:hypothetical protein
MLRPWFSSLPLAHADTPKLRVDEDGIWDNTISSAGAAVLKQIGAQNAEVVVRHMGESWTSFHITHCVTTGTERLGTES